MKKHADTDLLTIPETTHLFNCTVHKLLDLKKKGLIIQYKVENSGTTTKGRKAVKYKFSDLVKQLGNPYKNECKDNKQPNPVMNFDESVKRQNNEENQENTDKEEPEESLRDISNLGIDELKPGEVAKLLKHEQMLKLKNDRLEREKKLISYEVLEESILDIFRICFDDLRVYLDTMALTLALSPQQTEDLQNHFDKTLLGARDKIFAKVKDG